MHARCTATAQSSDAIAILKADHNKIKQLFKTFDVLHEDRSDEETERVARQICIELTIHATVEEEIFYPEVRAALDNRDLTDKAEIEHAVAKELIAQIQKMDPSDAKYAAKVAVLGAYINHHIKEEQDGLFRRARKADLDMGELGARILARKYDLEAEMALPDESDEKEDPIPFGTENSYSRPSQSSHA